MRVTGWSAQVWFSFFLASLLLLCWNRTLCRLQEVFPAGIWIGPLPWAHLRHQPCCHSAWMGHLAVAVILFIHFTPFKWVVVHICEGVFLYMKDRQQKKQEPEGGGKWWNLSGSDNTLKRSKRKPKTAALNNALNAGTAATLAKRTKRLTDYFSLRVGGWDLFSLPLSLP